MPGGQRLRPVPPHTHYIAAVGADTAVVFGLCEERGWFHGRGPAGRGGFDRICRVGYLGGVVPQAPTQPTSSTTMRVLHRRAAGGPADGRRLPASGPRLRRCEVGEPGVRRVRRRDTPRPPAPGPAHTAARPSPPGQPRAHSAAPAWQVDAPVPQACLNGARPDDAHPRLPISPHQLARDARAVAGLGIGSVHVHPRCRLGRATIDPRHIADVVAAIRAAAPALEISVPTARWVAPDPHHRVEAVSEWGRLGPAKPDVVAVNVGEQGWLGICAAAHAGAIGLELRVSTPAHAVQLRLAGLPPKVIRVCAEITTADPTAALTDATRILRALDPIDAPILLHGTDTSAWPLWAHATQRGLHTRVGLHDMLTRPDGSPTPGNPDLIEHALRTRPGPWPQPLPQPLPRPARAPATTPGRRGPRPGAAQPDSSAPVTAPRAPIPVAGPPRRGTHS